MPHDTKRAWKILWPAIEKADAVLEVLDARNPGGTRCHELERKVLESGDKILVLVLNKIDLVPRWVVSRWFTHLSRDCPVLPINARHPDNIHDFLGKLKRIFREHPRWRGINLKFRVLIVGYPNSGKSTLIQALTENKKKVRSSSQAGFTRGIQLIALSDKIYLIDTPGVIPPENDDEIHQALDTCSISPQKVEDKETVVDEIFRRIGLETLNKIYGLDATDQYDFIELLGKARGYLAKGGKVKEVEVQKLLIKDWQQNKIPFYHLPEDARDDANSEDNLDDVEDAGASFEP